MSDTTENKKYFCWICYQEEDWSTFHVSPTTSIAQVSINPNGPFTNNECQLTSLADCTVWVQPCLCRGSMRWVHQRCLQRWINQKQNGISNVNVTCPQCRTAYQIYSAPLSFPGKILDLFDLFVQKVCPPLAGALLIGSVYWTAVTFGAVTIMQVLGHSEGLELIQNADPIFLLMGLPAIPVLLVASRMIKWETAIFRVWRSYMANMDLCKYIFGSFRPSLAKTTTRSSNPTQERELCELQHFFLEQLDEELKLDREQQPALLKVIRNVMGGLLLPTAATACGKLFFERVCSNIQRTLLGGITFVTIKGFFKIYYKKQQLMRKAFRLVLNANDKSVEHFAYEDDIIRFFIKSNQSMAYNLTKYAKPIGINRIRMFSIQMQKYCVDDVKIYCFYESTNVLGDLLIDQDYVLFRLGQLCTLLTSSSEDFFLQIQLTTKNEGRNIYASWKLDLPILRTSCNNSISIDIKRMNIYFEPNLLQVKISDNVNEDEEENNPLFEVKLEPRLLFLGSILIILLCSIVLFFVPFIIARKKKKHKK
ncbi:hypothetical protein SNEBB_006733 [Seison nebaliae]|nr:hypothetical protein SNEBB_006733 [Seison nebaliae]